jgi:hypothetical protein
MKDKILFLTIGLLIGLVVMQWGIIPQSAMLPVAHAGYVDNNATGIVAMNENLAFDHLGRIWAVSVASGWTEFSTSPLPISMNDVKFVASRTLVTNSNVGWKYEGNMNEWIEAGPWPGSQPVPTEKQSWGSIKGNYNN